MKPAATMSHNEMKRAVLQKLQRENTRALGFNYARHQEGFSDMR